MRLGIDTGGTFTDFVLLAPGLGRVHKVASTPENPLQAILTGLKEICPGGLSGVEIVHGTTVGTNAFLTRQGARVVLVTTRGFEDVLFIGRQTRRELFSLTPSRPTEVLPRERVVGVTERLRADGSVLLPLASEETTRVCREVAALRPEAVAVSLLHSYANPENEIRLGEALATLGVPVSLSSRILPEIREFERTSATVLNAYLSPVISRYLEAFSRELSEVPLFIQQSNGGFLSSRAAADFGLGTVLSGPAGGVAGAFRLGQDLGETQLLTFDMGGTSTDVALVAGETPFTSEYVLDGYPLGLPVLDIHTVGAGGGSIAWRDRGGALRVGPHSAGADPGPVCYGRGTQVTVTDAQVVLGRLLPTGFLGGRLPLFPEAAHQAMHRLAAAFGVKPEKLALAIIEVVNQHMAKALAQVSLKRGHDPRQFTLVCYGGAGGLHVCELARELGIKRILLPTEAGVLSALGLARSGLRRSFSRTLLWHGPRLTWTKLKEACHQLKGEALKELSAEGLDPQTIWVTLKLQMRYRGQSYTLGIPWSRDFLREFHRCHLKLYGHAFPDREVEVVILRLHCMAPEVAGPLPPFVPALPGAAPALPSHTWVYLPGGPARLPVYYRPELTPGSRITGPALLAEDFATTLIFPGFTGEVAPSGHLFLLDHGGGTKN
jgi:N-methylhydantoinase A